MDIFNKKKLKELQHSIELLQNEISVLNKENHLLEEKYTTSESELTEFFKKRYIGGAYKFEDSDEVYKLLITNISYEAGTINITCDLNKPGNEFFEFLPDMKIYGSVSILDKFHRITKKEFANG